MKIVSSTHKSVFSYSGVHAKLYYVLLVLVGTFIIAASSQIQIPLELVPVTLQSFAVLLVGMGLGWRLGALTVVVYLLEGAIGLPVFAGFTFGFPVLFAVTGGYLIAFPFSAALAGWLVEHGLGRNFIGAAVAALVGLVLISLVGAAYLSLFIGWHNAFLFGLAPFILGEGLKAVLLAFIVPALWCKQK